MAGEVNNGTEIGQAQSQGDIQRAGASGEKGNFSFEGLIRRRVHLSSPMARVDCFTKRRPMGGKRRTKKAHNAIWKGKMMYFSPVERWQRFYGRR